MTRRGASSRLSAEERDARLRIMQADGIGSAAIKVLAAATSSAAEALSLGMDAWRALGGLDERHVAALQAAERAPVDIAWPDGWDLYWPADGDYPPLLREIDDPPMFWAMGDVAMLHQFCVAVVGTRKCSDYGRRTAYMLSGALVAAGACVVSGLAYGIDAAAHKGALVEEGSTVAVMGCGPGRVYPGGNRSLQKRIGDEGVLVSEFLPDAKPAPWHFPRRNRIISGLCKATVVVEAYDSGGALVTAARAREQDREVFAVPGSIEMPMARGTNRLIADGAGVVVSPMDLVERLRFAGCLPKIAGEGEGGAGENTGGTEGRSEPSGADDRGAAGRTVAPLPDDLTTAERGILSALARSERTPEAIMDEARILPSAFWSGLARLEGLGLVRILPGGRYGRTGTRARSGAATRSGSVARSGPATQGGSAARSGAAREKGKKRASRSTPPGDRLA